MCTIESLLEFWLDSHWIYMSLGKNWLPKKLIFFYLWTWYILPIFSSLKISLINILKHSRYKFCSHFVNFTHTSFILWCYCKWHFKFQIPIPHASIQIQLIFVSWPWILKTHFFPFISSMYTFYFSSCLISLPGPPAICWRDTYYRHPCFITNYGGERKSFHLLSLGMM